MADAVREVSMRALRQASIVLTAILPSLPLTGVGIVINLLRLFVYLFNFIGKRLGFLPVSRPCKNNEHTYKYQYKNGKQKYITIDKTKCIIYNNL